MEDIKEKPLSLGSKLKYPITINKLLKRPGDDIKKQEPLLQYKFTWMKKVGDPFGEEWEEEQTTIADWDSPVDGSLESWRIREGMTVERDLVAAMVKETCPHSVQFAGLCGMCGKDMTEMSWASASADTERAKINMIHDQTSLTVSQDVASEAESQLQKRLLKDRKLSLVVDLDQTIIHACIEPTVGEWQRDVNSPNYAAVKDVKSFQLNDDGPRGLASGCWYYIKMRPGLAKFLSKISELYELHVYTMGTRAYALNIAKIVDPDKKLFGDRIISRDENGNVTAKSLARLFPQSTNMVVIIDDRADVWPMNRPNLIKVVPYDFFLGIGDINSSFLPKREELPKAPPPLKRRHEKPEPTEDSETAEVPTEAPEVPTEEATKSTEEEKLKQLSTEALPNNEPRVSALEELVRMGGGEDESIRLEQAAAQEKFLEKQLTERPLLHAQEKLDQLDEEEEQLDEDELEAIKDCDKKDGNHHQRHNLLKDDDNELEYLEQHLTQLHKAFYDEYDSAPIRAEGGRVAQLKHGQKRRKESTADLKVVPNIGHVMPRLKAKTLEGCVIVMSGLVPLGVDLMRQVDDSYNLSYEYEHLEDYFMHSCEERANLLHNFRSEIAQQTESFGARLRKKVTKRITHVVASTSRTRTAKVRQAAKYPNIKIVNQQWLLNSMSKWKKEDETPYLVAIHPSDRKSDGDTNSPSSSLDDSDEYGDYGDSNGSDEGSEGEDEDTSNLPSGSQEVQEDDEGVMPEDIEPGHSPIDDLKTFDWNTVDNELAEFMEDDDSESGNESDTGSIASNSSRESQSSRKSNLAPRKRKYDEATDDEDSDEASTLAKKQRVANSRTTGLKTVKTPTSHSESSLPTPGVTGDENEDAEDTDSFNQIGAADNDADSMSDLEADMLAEFEKEELEAAASSGDGG